MTVNTQERFRVLIVDDEPDYLRLLHLRLSGFGYAVVTIDNGNNILVTARNTKPDLIVLDINISEVNGFEVYRLLRRDSVCPISPLFFQVPMLLTTSLFREMNIRTLFF